MPELNIFAKIAAIIAVCCLSFALTAVTWEETKGFPPMEIGGVTIEIKGTDHGVKLNVSM